MGEEKLAAHAPLGRLGDDEDLKGLTVLYASDAGKHITGQWLAVDGGVRDHWRLNSAHPCRAARRPPQGGGTGGPAKPGPLCPGFRHLSRTVL
jgi:hypothetical protein